MVLPEKVIGMHFLNAEYVPERKIFDINAEDSKPEIFLDANGPLLYHFQQNAIFGD